MTPRLLIVKLAALGDAVMASTLVGALRDRWPGAHITWVAGRSVAPLARLFEGVDRVIEIDDRRLLRGGVLARGRELFTTWRAVGRGYDLAFVGHSDRRYAVLTALCGAREVRRVPLGKGSAGGAWHGAVYAALAGSPESPGTPGTPGSPGTPGTPPRFATLRSLGAGPVPEVAQQGPLVVIAPGGARNVLRDDALRRWPLGHWVELVRQLTQAGCTVVAVGAAHDAAEGAACAAAGAGDFTGRTELRSLLSMIEGAACVVTHDSGVMHLALLVRSPVVALFGPTAPAERLAPGANVTVMSSAAGLPCAPCYDGTAYAPCTNNQCLNRVEAGRVARAVLDVVGASRGGAAPSDTAADGG